MGKNAYSAPMMTKLISASLAALGFLSLASCGTQQERQVVLPESRESDIPWNRMQEGEGLGQLGAFQQR